MAASQPSPAIKSSQTPAPALLKVLILDDERFDRHRLARLCSGLSFPCEVSNAKTLAEFDHHLTQTKFGLILLDYALPDGTGLDALSMMHLCARNLNTPTLMVSGQAQRHVVEQAQAAGCCGYLSKDALSPDEFTRAVTDALMLTAPLLAADHTTFDASQVEQLLARSVALCAQDIKPMVSRLMRQMRNLRAQRSGAEGAGTHAVEQDCLSLWTFLVELERQDGAALLANITTPAAPIDVPPPNARPAKPPSPFSAPRA